MHLVLLDAFHVLKQSTHSFVYDNKLVLELSFYEPLSRSWLSPHVAKLQEIH